MILSEIKKKRLSQCCLKLAKYKHKHFNLQKIKVFFSLSLNCKKTIIIDVVKDCRQ